MALTDYQEAQLEQKELLRQEVKNARNEYLNRKSTLNQTLNNIETIWENYEASQVPPPPDYVPSTNVAFPCAYLRKVLEANISISSGYGKKLNNDITDMLNWLRNSNYYGSLNEDTNAVPASRWREAATNKVQQSDRNTDINKIIDEIVNKINIHEGSTPAGFLNGININFVGD